jgi:hypothetical protein
MRVGFCICIIFTGRLEVSEAEHMEAHSQNDLHVIENRNRREGIEWGNPK